MPPLRERCNLFREPFRIAPPPLIPEEWKVSRETPPTRAFWVHRSTGEVAARPGGDDWQFEETLRLWSARQALRVWVGRRLIRRHGEEEARRRIRDLERNLRRRIRSATAYLDLLLVTAFEAHYLSHIGRRTRSGRALRERAEEQAKWWRRQTERLQRKSPASAARILAAARALDTIAADRELGLRPPRGPDDERLPDEISGRPRPRRRQVWRWVDYQMRSSRYRHAGLHWLLARAILHHRDSTVDEGSAKAGEYAAQVDRSTRRVFGYLALLDAVPSTRPTPSRRRGERGRRRAAQATTPRVAVDGPAEA